MLYLHKKSPCRKRRKSSPSNFVLRSLACSLDRANIISICNALFLFFTWVRSSRKYAGGTQHIHIEFVECSLFKRNLRMNVKVTGEGFVQVPTDDTWCINRLHNVTNVCLGRLQRRGMLRGTASAVRLRRVSRVRHGLQKKPFDSLHQYSEIQF